VVRLPGRGRPEPPATLAQAEQSAWRAIVDSSPDRWLDPAAQLVLRRIVAEIAIAERHEERLRRIGESGDDLEAELEIAHAHRQTTKSILDALTVLRATPRSRMAARNARDMRVRPQDGDPGTSRRRPIARPNDVWAAQGFIELVPGASVSYEYVARRLRELCEEYDIRRIAFDRWGMGHFVP
jgi:hypothetical protein